MLLIENDSLGSESFFQILPYEIKEKIFVDVPNLFSLSTVCSQWNNMISDLSLPCLLENCEKELRKGEVHRIYPCVQKNLNSAEKLALIFRDQRKILKDLEERKIDIKIVKDEENFKLKEFWILRNRIRDVNLLKFCCGIHKIKTVSQEYWQQVKDGSLTAAKAAINLRKILNNGDFRKQNILSYAGGLTELSPEIEKLSHLQHLYLNKNRLTTLSIEIESFIQLQGLWLNHNQFSFFPSQIAKLTQLKILSLDHNKLKNIPSHLIEKLTHLESLFLDHNQLKALPSELGNLTHLKKLSVKNNQLENLPYTMRNLNSLEELLLENNQLKEWPFKSTHLTNLQSLSLANNPLNMEAVPHLNFEMAEEG